MYKIQLKNNKLFDCSPEETIFNAAKNSGINLDHSCLSARCRSCIVKVLHGKTKNIEDELVLTKEEKNDNFVLSCNAKPISDLKLDIEDLNGITFYDKKIVPAKVDFIKVETKDVIRISLRLPPNSDFKFNSGQYVNLNKGNLTRSYSIANKYSSKNQLEFFIKKYQNGLMSKYWFEDIKPNDLLRIEGPVGTFFLRKSNFKNIIFLATGTGVAPIIAMLEDIEEYSKEQTEKSFWLFVGARFKEDLFWTPKIDKLNIKYIPVLSRQNNNWDGEKGYVQDVLLKQQIDLENAQVYACGSSEMINSAKELLFKNNLTENNFFSDAFVQTN